jgi:hypothetical protein
LSEQLIGPRLQARSTSQHSGSDDRLPEEHTKTRNHKNPKDKAPRVATEGLVVVGGQPVGIAHAKLSVARQQRSSLPPSELGRYDCNANVASSWWLAAY